MRTGSSLARPSAPRSPQPAFRDVQYVAFSDALTGAPVSRLADSTARGGAVVLSVAAGIGRTRLLDNIMLVGDHSHLGAIEGATARRPRVSASAGTVSAPSASFAGSSSSSAAESPAGATTVEAGGSEPLLV